MPKKPQNTQSGNGVLWPSCAQEALSPPPVQTASTAIGKEQQSLSVYLRGHTVHVTRAPTLPLTLLLF